MRLILRSVRIRLTLWYAVALATIVFLFSCGVFWFVRARLLGQLDQQLASDLELVERVIREEPDELDEVEEYGPSSMFQVSEGGKGVLSTSAWRRAELDGVLQFPMPGDSSFGKTQRGSLVRLRAAQVSVPDHTYQVVVARDAEPVHRMVRSLMLTLLCGLPCALGLAAVGGYFLASRFLSPLDAMATKARHITAERLHERLPVENPEDELGRLAMVLNDALARLEDSFERLRRFTADASHELRTPLTAMRSVGEVGLRDRLESTEYRDIIGSMLEEADRLTRLVDSLLILTRADAGKQKVSIEAFNLCSLVHEVSDCLRVLAEEKSQSLSVDCPNDLMAVGDRTTLRLALMNLLDNAVKYTGVRGHIQVAVREMPGNAVSIEVKDDGPGVPREHQAKIFERFYRVDQGRSSEARGSGLGLAIAQWAVRLNQGTIELHSVEGHGSSFRVVLPLSKGGDGD